VIGEGQVGGVVDDAWLIDEIIRRQIILNIFFFPKFISIFVCAINDVVFDFNFLWINV